MARVLLLLSLMLQPGCYEGWENYRGAGEGEEEPIPEETPGIKPIYYILYQPIVMSEAAINDPRCLANQAIAEYKSNEWSLRTTKTTQMLTEIAEKVVISPISIGINDCQNMTAVSAMADTLAPWGLEDPPEQDSLDRMSIHLKNPMWEEEPTASPSSRVTDRNWAAWRKLRSEGKRAVSGHYFVLSNSTNGYFTEWREAQIFFDVLDGTPIDNPDPSEAGLGARESIVNADVADLKIWLLELSRRIT